MSYISVIDRMKWGSAALTALREGQDADAIIAAYCQAKEGNPAPYDELLDVASDAVTDSLHALTAEQKSDESYERVIAPEELDLTEFNELITVISNRVNQPDYNPEFGPSDYTRRAFSHFLEEQEESLQDE